MATDLPNPPVPASLDLRDYPSMLLDVVRLRDSELAALASDAGFKAAVLLWCASWHQVPAGSLPDDDRVLCRLAGKKHIGAWRAIRGEALRGFRRCNDGRLYHDVVCIKAQEALDRRSKQAESAANAREAKAKKRVLSRQPLSETERNSVCSEVKVSKVKGKENQNQSTPASSLAAHARAFDEGRQGQEAAGGDSAAPPTQASAPLKLPPKVVEHVPPEDHARQQAFVELARTLVQEFRKHHGEAFTLATDRVYVWENQGFKPAVILAAIRDRLGSSRSARVATHLKWFDNAIAEAHVTAKALGALPSTAGRTPAEADEAWRRRIRNFRTDVSSWVAGYGPRPGTSGCKAPIPILVEFGYPISTDKPVLVHNAQRPRSATA